MYPYKYHGHGLARRVMQVPAVAPTIRSTSRLKMNRNVCNVFLLVLLSLTLPAGITSWVAAQDLGDIDMFGDDTADDPSGDAGMGLDDPGLGLGGDDLGGQDPGLDPQPMNPVEQQLLQGKQLADEGRCGEAMQIFNGLLAQNPQLAPAHLEKARCLATLTEYTLALQSLDAALGSARAFPGVEEAVFFERGEILMTQQLFGEAVETYNQLVQLNPMNADYLYKRGKALLRGIRSQFNPNPANDIDLAIASLDRAIELQDIPEAYIERAEAYQLQNKFDKAIADIDLAAQANSDDPDVHWRRGATYLARAENERRSHNSDLGIAIDDYQVALDAFTQFIDLEGDKTKDDYDDADSEKVTLGQGLSARVTTRLAMGRELEQSAARPIYEAMLADCDRMIDYDEDNYAAYYYQGIAHRLMDNLEEAIGSFDKALEIRPGDPTIHLRRGIAWYYLGDNRLARRDFEVSQADFSGRGLFWTGVTYAKEGEFREAIRLYTASLRNNPAFKPAFSNRGLAYMQVGDFARAEKDFDELVRRDNEDQLSRQRRDQARSRRMADAGPPSRYYP